MGKRKSVETEDSVSIEAVDFDKLPPEFLKSDKPLGLELHVFNFLVGGILTHICMLYYIFYLWPFGYVPRWSLLFIVVYGYMTGLGITVGVHRYWTHKTFKANKPLKVIMMLMHTAALQHPIFKWCRDHRVHHKYMDTNADPHSAARGFWFSHITWAFQPRHPELIKALRTVEISDLVRDPIVRFQANIIKMHEDLWNICRYYWELVLVVFLIVPMVIFRILFPEMSWLHIFIANMMRYGGSLHITFLINSVAHKWGNRPYDQYISPTESHALSILTVGEGSHNYHHTFPWDYKSAEFGYTHNLSTTFIHFFAWIGWAWDMKTVSRKLLADRINRTGDGSHPLHNNSNNDETTKDNGPIPACWGWGDKELKKEDVEITETLFPSKFQ